MDPAALSDDALRREMAAHIWFHSIELRPGIVTPGNKTAALLEAERQAVLEPLTLPGRSVLDIGAWNGFWSFAAKRQGAARVVAMDWVTWRDPGFRGRASFAFAQAATGLAVEAVERDVTTLDPDIGLFDVVLFLGVFYHLFDPVPVLRRLRAITREVLVLETHQDLLDQARPAMAFYPGRELANDPTNWWGPNPALVFHLLRDAGFAHVLYQPHPEYGAVRGIYHAFPSATPGPVLREMPSAAIALDPAELARLAAARA